MGALPFVTHHAQLTTTRDGYPVELLIIHETAGVWPGDENFLAGGPRSVNWFIRPDGTLVCMTPPDATGHTAAAAHAGVCAWGPYRARDGRYAGGTLQWGWANLASEGVEVSGRNDGTPWDRRQAATLLALVRWRMQVLHLAPDRVVRHRDVAWPSGRKNDPRGLDWAWVQAQLQPAPAAPAMETLIGLDGKPVPVPAAMATFYNQHGGLLTFGYPTGPTFDAPDPTGEPCTFLPLEVGFLKVKPSMPEGWRIRLAPVGDVTALLARRA